MALVRLTTAITAAALGALALLAGPAAGSDAGKRDGLRDVVFVGNNWEGTADVLKPRGDFGKVADPIDIIPDEAERMDEITNPLNPDYDPTRLPYFLAIQQLIGEGNNQYVDDMYTSNDGRLLVVSRPSFADVVGIELKTGEIAWRFVVAGQRSDHMALSPDGKEVAVSASTGNVVHILDVETGEEVDQFPSGDSPHENVYSANGKRLVHASIGMVYTPTDQPEADTTKGERVFQIVDTDGYDVIETLDMGEELAEAGYEDMSSAVRPMAIAPQEHKVFFQVSFFHGFVQYSFRKDRVTRVVELPNLVPDVPREEYLLDSAHHGIAINPSGERLCVAGTMSDYAAIVTRRSFNYKLLKKGTKPYWATTSNDGRYCFVSWSGTDSISVFSYRKRREIAHVEVGDHPQRVRMGVVRQSWLDSQD